MIPESVIVAEMVTNTEHVKRFQEKLLHLGQEERSLGFEG
jgi:hypothetical protein